jgi:hypothetical protein
MRDEIGANCECLTIIQLRCVHHLGYLASIAFEMTVEELCEMKQTYRER